MVYIIFLIKIFYVQRIKIWHIEERCKESQKHDVKKLFIIVENRLESRK